MYKDKYETSVKVVVPLLKNYVTMREERRWFSLSMWHIAQQRDSGLHFHKVAKLWTVELASQLELKAYEVLESQSYENFVMEWKAVNCFHSYYVTHF